MDEDEEKRKQEEMEEELRKMLMDDSDDETGGEHKASQQQDEDSKQKRPEDDEDKQELKEAYQRMLLEDSDEEPGGAPKASQQQAPKQKKSVKDDKRSLLNESPEGPIWVIPSNNGTPPPPPPGIMVEDCGTPPQGKVKDCGDKNVPVILEPGEQSTPDTAKSPQVNRTNSPSGERTTSPSGKSSSFRSNKVEPLNVDDTVIKVPENAYRELHNSQNNNIDGGFKDEGPMFDLYKTSSMEKVSTPDSGVDSLGSIKRSSVKTISDGFGMKRKQSRTNKVFIRTFKQRANQENFALYGLLTPALCLVPKIDGNDALTQTFTELNGEDRELKLAAAHIDDAISGRGKYGKARAFFKNRKGRWCFKMIESKLFKVLVLLMATLHLILTFFESPTIVSNSNTLPIILALTPLCLIVYTVDVGIHMGFLSWPVFWTLDENRWIRREFILTCMYIIDYVMMVIEVVLNMRLAQPFRCLRAAIILCKLNNVQHIWDVVMSIIIKLTKVFFIIVIFITLFSAVGVHMYDDTYHNIPSTSANCTGNETNIYVGAFDHVGITFLRLFVLLSTENYPDLMIPAFITNSWNFIYFGIFLFVGVFFLTAIILAIIVDSYWSFAKKHVKMERARERAELAKAWNLLDPLGKGSLPINDGRFLKLLHILKPQHTEEMNQQLIDYLDANDDGQVDSLEWTIRLNEALSFEFEEDKCHDMEMNSKCVSGMQDVTQKIIRSKVFSTTMLVLIVIHCILFCFQWHGMTETARIGIHIFKTVILAVFVVEIFLRVMAEGKNLVQFVELLDIGLIVIALAANIPVYFPIQNYGVCNIISGLAITARLGLNSAQTKKGVILFSTKLFPVMFDLIILVFIIVFFMAVIGWELFIDIPPDLSYTSGVYDYNCGIGFNSFSCALLIVFQMVTTSNWHEIMNAAMVATTPWACLYFVACFVVINLVIMNLFVAIAIEAFNKLGTDKEGEKAPATPETKENEEGTFAVSAMSFLNNWFESSRSEQDKEKLGQKPPGSARMRRPSRVSVTTSYGAFPGSPGNFREVPAITSIMEEEEAEEEEEEDLSGLTRDERKKRMMKKKRAQKKKNVKTMMVVMTAFRATKDSELNLCVGEEIEIVGKQDEWWEGRKNDDVQGWFPASHVKELKRSQAPPLPTPYAQRPHVARRATSDSMKYGWSDSDDNLPSFGKSNSKDKLMSTSGSTTSVDSLGKRPRLKLKNTGGNWRKEILGDITVMNPQELKDLNKILKSQHSISSRSGMNTSLGGSLRRQPTLSEMIEEESEPESKPEPKTAPVQPPMINVQSPPPLPSLVEGEEDDEEGANPGKDTLTVDKPELPKELKKKKNKEQLKNGEMPSWATKFLQSNNIKASVDVKFDEGASKQESEKGEDIAEDKV